MAHSVGSWPGGKSAKVLGHEFGLNAPEMNSLLKEHGYLDGQAGAYSLTEKGQRFGAERFHSNGVGGSAQYQVQYETRGWSDDLVGALRVDLAAAAKQSQNKQDSPVEPANEDPEDDDDAMIDPNYGDNSADLTGKVFLVIGAIIAGLVIVWALVSYGPRLWRDRIQPAINRRRKQREMRRAEKQLRHGQGR